MTANSYMRALRGRPTWRGDRGGEDDPRLNTRIRRGAPPRAGQTAGRFHSGGADPQSITGRFGVGQRRRGSAPKKARARTKGYPQGSGAADLFYGQGHKTTSPLSGPARYSRGRFIRRPDSRRPRHPLWSSISAGAAALRFGFPTSEVVEGERGRLRRRSGGPVGGRVLQRARARMKKILGAVARQFAHRTIPESAE